MTWSEAMTATAQPSPAQRQAQSMSVSENGKFAASNPPLRSQASRRTKSGLVKTTSQVRQRIPPLVCHSELFGACKLQRAARFCPSANDSVEGNRIPYPKNFPSYCLTVKPQAASRGSPSRSVTAFSTGSILSRQVSVSSREEQRGF